ncbi:MAG: hypothetical protein EP343_23090 [Deltaproteobacteria bacterium]|nr:MAG: hypothetical protein EP343_23090 [Deltaproteobacteria bacterium]
MGIVLFGWLAWGLVVGCGTSTGKEHTAKDGSTQAEVSQEALEHDGSVEQSLEVAPTTDENQRPEPNLPEEQTTEADPVEATTENVAQDTTPQESSNTEVVPEQTSLTDCKMTHSSDLSGVSIDMTSTRCRFTLAEIAQGQKLSYLVKIGATQVKGLTFYSKQQDGGGCQQPGSSGLRVFYRIQGGGQNYCICDTGLCQGNSDFVSLQGGEFAEAFDWDGKNWNGPSDTGNPKGAAFPAGTYTLTLKIVGNWKASPDGPETPFTVMATKELVLSP